MPVMCGRRPRTSSTDEVVRPPRKQRKFRHFFKEEEKVLSNRKMDKHQVVSAVVEEEEIKPKEEERMPNWSEIVPEILELIMVRMHIGDCIQASRVCKHWRCVALGTTILKSRPFASYGSPCCVRLLDGNKRCAITDPLRKERFIIETPSLPDRVGIMCSGYGWLLLAANSFSINTATRSLAGYDRVLLFNPLTTMIIQLPPSTICYCDTFSFSAPPTSSNCVVIGMTPSRVGSGTDIHYCRPGDRTWTIVNMSHCRSKFRATNRPVFFKDRIYVWGHKFCEVGIYDLSAGIMTSIIETGWRMSSNTEMRNLVVVDDKLMSVCINSSDGSIYIYELDELNNEWIVMNSIGEQRLFSSPINCMFMKAATTAGELEEKIHIIGMKEMMSCSYRRYELQTIRRYKDAAEYNIAFNARRSACWIELMP